MKRPEKRDLLDEIAKLAGLQYLSDVRVERHRSAVCIAIENIASENYSCAEWIEAAEYITGKRPADNADTKETVEYILQMMQAED
ncbi:MAG: hypothetical protein ACI4LZ_01950 [Anaerovoracaceae bacterium]